MIHSNLRKKTQNLHIAVEQKLAVLLSDQISVDQYAAVQKMFYGFYKPVEARLCSIRGWDDPELEVPARLKLPLLIGDLNFLTVDAAEIARLPLCKSLPRLKTVAEALGCLYVLEGATLGGRIITGHLKKVLPLDESRGCSFFNSYGSDTGRMWTAFLGILARHCERHGDDDAVVDSACQTFASLGRWLDNAA